MEFSSITLLREAVSDIMDWVRMAECQREQIPNPDENSWIPEQTGIDRSKKLSKKIEKFIKVYSNENSSH